MYLGKDKLAHAKAFVNAFACRKLYEIVGPVPIELYNFKCHITLVHQLRYAPAMWHAMTEPLCNRFPVDICGLFAFWVMSVFYVALFI